MNKHRIFFICLLAWTAGCGSSKPSRFYVLSRESQPIPTDAKMAPLVIGVGPVHLPDVLDRAQIVTRLNGNEVHVSEIHRWAEPLSKSLPAVLAENLSSNLAPARTVIHPWSIPPEPDFQVKVNIIQLDGPLAGPVVLDAEWTLIDLKTKQVAASVNSRMTEECKSANAGEYVAAESRLIGRLAEEIAKSVRNVAR